MNAKLSIHRIMVEYELASDDVVVINRNMGMLIMTEAASFGNTLILADDTIQWLF